MRPSASERMAIGMEPLVERVVRRLHVIRPGGRERVGERQALLPARVVHRELLPLDVHREPLGAAAEPLRRALDALAEELADPFPAADQVDHLLHRLGAAPDELDPARVGLGDDAVLVALHREGDGDSRGDRVEHVLRQELIDLGERVEVADPAERSGGRERLVLGPAELRRHPELLHLDLPLARHHAGVAGAAVDEDGLRHLLAADRLGVLEGAVAEIPGRQDAARLEVEEAARRADLVEAVTGAVVVLLEAGERGLGPDLVRRRR